MKKYVYLLNAIELLEQLMNGKHLKGALYIDQSTGTLTFKAYNSKPIARQKDELVKKLPWGWVKESLERIKVYGSFPKNLGTAAVINLQDDHNRSAKNALIEREIVEFC